jgi:hypothetical protein
LAEEGGGLEVIVKQNQEAALISMYAAANMYELQANATFDPQTISAYQATVDELISRYFLKQERALAPSFEKCKREVEPEVNAEYNSVIKGEQQGTVRGAFLREKKDMWRLRAVQKRHDYIRDVLERRGQLVPFVTEEEKEL